jgi:putative lipoprotein
MNKTSAAKTVTGNALYRERMALPPNAVLTVRLEDVSRADAAADVIGEQTIKLDGKQAPIPFEIAYAPAKIDPRHRYNVRAQIDVDGTTMFTSAQATPVLTEGHPAHAQVMMQRARPSTAEAAASESPLVNTYWKLTEVNGSPIGAPPQGAREPHLVLTQQENRFHGFGGVNQLLGSFKLDWQNLTIRPGPMTQAAGPAEAMNQERAFTRALTTVTSYKIAGQDLTMFAGDKPVLKFQAVYLR